LVSLVNNKVKIKDFSYSGEAPDAFFYVGTSGVPSENGFKIKYPAGSEDILGKYSKEDVEFDLPEGVSADDVVWVSVWCREYKVNFGEVMFTPDSTKATTPASPLEAQLTSREYGVKGRVTLQNGKVIIEDFSYDGKAPDAFFYVGTSGVPSGKGHRILYPEGNDNKLGKYTSARVEFGLPSGVNETSVAWVSVWCREYSKNFGEAYFNGFSGASVWRMSGVVVAVAALFTLMLL